MCEICRINPCDSRCPNAASDHEVKENCDKCRANIYAGDEYYELDGWVYCASCIENSRKEAV